MSEELLRVTDLNVHYGAIHAVKGISFSVNRGEIVALIGANGAGKTTTLQAISGLTPWRGSIRFEDQELASLAPHQVARRGLVQAPEGRGIFANLTVRENLDLGAYCRRDQAEIRRDLEQAFSLFGRLRERTSQRAGTLSGGEQQMLAIARALMARPKILLLDEPSLGLAPLIAGQIFATLGQLNRERGTTVLLVEQNANQALKISQRAYVLETGTIRLSGPARELMHNEGVRKSYLGG